MRNAGILLVWKYQGKNYFGDLGAGGRLFLSDLERIGHEAWIGISELSKSPSGLIKRRNFLTSKRNY
jgi:hypothetical protein